MVGATLGEGFTVSFSSQKQARDGRTDGRTTDRRRSAMRKTSYRRKVHHIDSKRSAISYLFMDIVDHSAMLEALSLYVYVTGFFAFGQSLITVPCTSTTTTLRCSKRLWDVMVDYYAPLLVRSAVMLRTADIQVGISAERNTPRPIT